MRRRIAFPGLGPRHLALATLGLIGMAVALATSLVPFPSTGGPQLPALAPDASGGCSGADAPPAATGSLALIGSSTPLPSLSGVPVRVDYFYTEETTVSSSTTEACVEANATASTGTGGAIDVPLALPPDRCVDSVCADFSGPYGPLRYSTSGAPTGFFEQDPTSGTSPATIAWEADLYYVDVNVSGSRIVSVNAPTPLSVSATSASGAPTPGALTYRWTVSGLEWDVSPNDTANVTVIGLDPTWVGAVSVTATVTYGDTSEAVTSAVTSLDPVATVVTSVTASPSPVDPGVPVTFVAEAWGAAGYAYTASIDPGLGATPVTGPCTAQALPNGSANLTCIADDTFATSGNSTALATVTNGFSTAQAYLLPFSVRPVELVSLDASRFVTYPNETVGVTIRVANGTGTPPYGPACLSVESEPGFACQPQAATAWNFSLNFSAPGEYEVHGYVVDRFGENVSAALGILVVPALSVRAEGGSTLTVRATASQPLDAVVIGGDLPIETNWNSTATTLAPCNTLLDLDGPISCSFSSIVQGWVNVTLTVTDALGSTARLLFRVNVTSAAPNPPAPAGGTSRPTLLLVLAALGVAAVLGAVMALELRRRGRGTSSTVEDGELERMARGREHLLSRASAEMPSPPELLASGWTGPPVQPEEWAEWIATLVAEGSLVPVRGTDHRLGYRRARPERPAARIEFDPSVWEASRGESPVADPETRQGRQGGG